MFIDQICDESGDTNNEPAVNECSCGRQMVQARLKIITGTTFV